MRCPRWVLALGLLLLGASAEAADLKQSTAYARTFLMISSSDHITGLTSATVSCTLSKAGGTFAASGGSVTELSDGWYKLSLSTTDTNTLGDLAYHCTATSADPRDFVDQVAANILGDTLPVNVTQWRGSTPNTLISGRVDSNSQVVGDKTGYSLSQTFPTNFSSLAITGGGAVTVGTNNDKTGYTVSTNSDKTGYSLSQAFPANFSSFSIDASGRIDLGKWIGSAPNALVQGRVDALQEIRTATAQGGGASSITLDAGASGTNGTYVSELVWILSGQGAGQVNTVSAYDGGTKVATVAAPWATAPNATSVFAVLPNGPVSATVAGSVTVGGYAAGQDPATSILVTPANKLATDGTGRVTVTQTFPSNFSTMALSSAGLTSAGGSIRKNVAGQKYPVYLVLASDHVTPLSGVSPAAKVSKDGAAGAAITGSIAEIDAATVPGWYLLSLSQADTNCGVCVFVVAAGGADPRVFYFLTAP